MIADTQRASYEAIKPHRGNLQEQVFYFIADSGGATDEEITNGLGMLKSSQTARRNELVNQGRVFDKGRRRVGSSGRKVIVWEAV